VTLVQAGPIDTDLNPENGPAADFIRSVTALGHYGRAEDVAALVAYLASEGGRYLTGTAITIDGGLAA
jgi:3-oxoacyl-[acyl-carrier protein] reductase